VSGANTNNSERYGVLRFSLGRCDLRVIVQLLRQQPSVLYRHPLLIAANLVLSCLLLPFKCYEKWRYGRDIAATEIEQPPLFILGHYRSGTTHLFNLLSQDDRYAYINSSKAALPDIYVTLDRLVRLFFPLISTGRRPCDNMVVAVDSAQEDEYAMTNRSAHSFLHVLSFPKSFRLYIEKYTLFSDINAAELREWKRCYRYLLKKLTFTEGGRQLLIKNPEHTGRLHVIAEMFPQGRYIHIVRNPYEVYVSSIYLYQSLFPYTAFQPVTAQEIRELVITRYQKMMRSYITNSPRIDPSRQLELRFEALERDPEGQLRDAYQTLGLTMTEQFESQLRCYSESISDYQKNDYQLSAEDIVLVNREWGFAFEHWGYPMLAIEQPCQDLSTT